MNIAKFLYPLIIILLLAANDNTEAQSKIKIAIWGDSRENLDNATSDIAAILLHKITDWDFQIHTGDFTHDGSVASWERTLHFPGVDSLFRKDKFFLCTSNHDAKDEDARANWDKYTSGVLPKNEVDGSTHFYAVQRGKVHVFFCDNFFTEKMVFQYWLDSSLKSVAPQDWILAVWHNVSYGDLGYKESYLDICGPWIQSLYKYGCRFILNGHAHLYVRTNPLSDDEKVDEKNGIVTIVNGTGGASWKDPAKPNEHIAYTPSEKSFPTITFLTISDTAVHLETVDCRPGKDLQVIDSYDYNKQR